MEGLDEEERGATPLRKEATAEIVVVVLVITFFKNSVRGRGKASSGEEREKRRDLIDSTQFSLDIINIQVGYFVSPPRVRKNFKRPVNHNFIAIVEVISSP